MQSTTDPNAISPPFAENWYARVTRHTKVVALLFLALVAPHAGLAFGPSPVRSYSVILTWDESPDEGIVAHRVYFGEVSGHYTDMREVGDETTVTLSELQGGVTHYFVVTAVHWSGLESEFSDEISFVPGSHRVLVPDSQQVTIGDRTTDSTKSIASTGTARTFALTVHGVAGHRYEVGATQDLETWTIVATVTVGEDGCVEFTDPAAAQFSARYYRTRRTPE